MELSKVLCAVDFSEPSRAAIRYAADLARQYDAELELLHVYHVPGYAFPEGVVVAGPEVMNDLLTQIAESLEESRRFAITSGATRVTTTSVQGTPWTEIVRRAEERGHDLIVVGTHGRTGLTHVLLGSVAEKVVRRAPCPVLTVRMPEASVSEQPAP